MKSIQRAIPRGPRAPKAPDAARSTTGGPKAPAAPKASGPTAATPKASGSLQAAQPSLRPAEASATQRRERIETQEMPAFVTDFASNLAMSQQVSPGRTRSQENSGIEMPEAADAWSRSPQTRPRAPRADLNVPQADLNAPQADLNAPQAPNAPQAEPGAPQAANPAAQAKGVIPVSAALGDTFDFQQQITTELNSPGDSLTYGLGADLTVAGGKVGGAGQLQISQSGENPPQYQVSVTGEAALGLSAQLGFDLGAAAGVKIEGEASGSLEVEMTFDTPAEAARAAETIMGEVVATAGSALPHVGDVMEPMFGAMPQDYRFLGEHISAIEASGELSAAISGSLGLQLDESLRLAGLSGQAGVSLGASARIEFPQDDSLGPQVTLQRELSGGVSGSAALGLRVGGSGQPSAGGNVGFDANGQLDASLAFSQNYQLPPDFTLDRLGQDPVGTLAQAYHQAELVDQSVDLSLSAGALGHGQTLQIGIDIDPQRLLDAGVPQALFGGDLGQAIQALDQGLPIHSTHSTYETSGINGGFSGSIPGFGAGLSLQYRVRDQTIHRSENLTVSQLLQELQQFFA